MGRSLFEMIEECKIYLFSFRFSVASHHWYFNCWKISMIYYYWMMMDIVTNYFARLNFIALIDDWISQVVLISLPWFTLQDIIKSSSQTEKIQTSFIWSKNVGNILWKLHHLSSVLYRTKHNKTTFQMGVPFISNLASLFPTDSIYFLFICSLVINDVEIENRAINTT